MSASQTVMQGTKTRSVVSSEMIDVAIIAAFCAAFVYLRWLKMDSLVWLDPGRWLFEAARFARGEIPYRDFSWQYPPFSVLFLGWGMRLFGIRFWVAQVAVDIVSIGIVFLAYALLRHILPRVLRLPAMILFMAVCVTSQMKFNLFSFMTYVPALQTGAAGCLIVLVAMVGYVRTGRLSIGRFIALAGGTFIASFSKPETLTSTWTLIVLLAIFDRYYWFRQRRRQEWIRHYSLVLTACFVPTTVAYLCTFAIAGLANTIAGISGYGLATQSCPWWPTGLGIFGAVAALGEAAAVSALISLTRRREFFARFGRQYYRAVTLAGVGAAIFAAYVVYLNRSLILEDRTWADRLKYSLPTVLWTNPVLLPVMWAAILCWLYLVLRVCTHRSFREHGQRYLVTLLVLTPSVVMCTRGLFNTTLDKVTEVSAICYPFCLLLAPYLLWRLLLSAGPIESVALQRSWSARVLIAGCLAYAAVRLAGGYSAFLSDRPYTTLQTQAGSIRLLDYKTNAEIYRFVMNNTSANDAVLDIPYGGGMNVATGRRSPVFTTQFQHWRLQREYLEKDLEQARRTPPKIVIAQDEPDYGAFYGSPRTGCGFPAFQWAPPAAKSDPHGIPLIQFIREKYRVAEKIGPKVLLVPK